tara:strand:- start:393 stop:497 length:105 start_codon:yes stop_codon:yes gene_type:complete
MLMEIKKIKEDQMNAVGKVLDIFPDCFPEVKKDK